MHLGSLLTQTVIITLISSIFFTMVSSLPQVPYVKPDGFSDILTRGSQIREGYADTMVDVYHLGKTFVDGRIDRDDY